MRVAVTGPNGFLGWHARCALHARGDHEVVPVSRAIMADQSALDAAMTGVDGVLHLAGFNRGTDSDLREGNPALAEALTASLDRVGARPIVVYANSIHAGRRSPYGIGKQAAADHLSTWASRNDGVVIDLRLPNLFGEHGRPHYNSVVATFCYELAAGRQPTVLNDRMIPILHAQDAADTLLTALSATASTTISPQGEGAIVSSLRDILQGFRDSYCSGQIPDIADPLHRALFNTYRSYVFPAAFPMHPTVHEDARGVFFECTRSAGGPAQVSCSTTAPGVTRGDHFHRRKIERFQVLMGTAVIELRRLFSDRVHTFTVSAANPAFIDMPTMWTHSITNVGRGELITLFWSGDLFDPAVADTFPEPVRLRAVH